MAAYLFLALLALAMLGCEVAGHAAFTCPVPRTPNAGEKVYPCGFNYFNAWNTSTTAIIAPGLLTVSWTETINHPGAPFRIALSIGGDCRYEEFILADHIPHNTAVSTTPKAYSFTVTIPNVNCMDTPCALQLLQIMTDKLASGTTCNTLGNVAPASCFSVYHSCANVRISGTVAPSAFTYTYTPPAGLANPVPNAWGYETGTWTNGWLSGQSTTVYQQPAACTAATPVANPSFPATCAECNYPAACGVTRTAAPTTTAGLPNGTATSSSSTTGSGSAPGPAATTKKSGPKVGELGAGEFAAAILTGLAFIALVVVVVVFVRPKRTPAPLQTGDGKL